LFGYEFSATVLVLTRSEVHVLASDKKIKLLEPLQATKGAVKVVLHT
jgi:nucleosome binding factor SPN SPT16 subunit